MGATTASPDDQDLATRVAELEATVARLSAALEARPPAPPAPSSRLEALGALGGLGSDTGTEADPMRSWPLTPLTPPATLHDGPADRATDEPGGDEPRRDEPRRDEPVRVDRRRLLGRAGVVAAGAVLGGAAATVATASPAAAATGSFDTSTATPAVTATSTGTGAAIKATNTTAPVGAPPLALDVDGPTTLDGIVRIKGTDWEQLSVESTQIAIRGEGGWAGVSAYGNSVGVDASANGIGVYAYGGVGVRAFGFRAPLLLANAGYPGGPAVVDPPPMDGLTHEVGELVFDKNNDLWLCVADGTPGTWVRVAGPGTTGALTILTTPTRVYDSRPGQPPNVDPQTKLTANTPRTGIALTTNNSGIPTDASAAIITATVVNTAGGAPGGPGFLTVYPDGIPTPSTSNLNWTSAGAVVANTTTVALGPGAKIAAFANRATDLIIDAIGYYR